MSYVVWLFELLSQTDFLKQLSCYQEGDKFNCSSTLVKKKKANFHSQWEKKNGETEVMVDK